MKKIIKSIVLTTILFLGACGNSNSPEAILAKAYTKMQDLDNFTASGKIDLTIGENETDSFSMPINLEARFLRNDKKNLEDDESYVVVDTSLLGMNVHSESWTKDGYEYINDGTYKYYREIDTTVGENIDPKQLAKQIIDACESIEVSKQDDKTILDLKVKDGSLNSILSSFGGDMNVDGLEVVDGALDNFTVDRFHILVNKDDYIESLYIEGNTEEDGMKMKMTMQLDIHELNTTTIPSFNKDDFMTEEEYQEVANTGGEFGTDLNGGYSSGFSDGFEPYEEIEFDDGTTITIDGSGTTAYYPYFDDEEQALYIMTETDIVGYGFFFFDKAMVEDIKNEIKNSTDYEIINDSKGNGYSIYSGYTPNSTELFDANTSFALYTYDNVELGLFLVGMEDRASFEQMVNTLKFTTY